MSATGQSPAIMAFASSDPQLANLALQRDENARIYFGENMYERYEQGSLKMIRLRAISAAARQPARSSNPKGSMKRNKRHCDVCSQDVFCFTRHNREIHMQDPSQILFCPVGTCRFTVIRDGSIQIDDHLANAHQDFRNLGGRGGELLELSTETSVISHLNKPTAIYILTEDYVKAEAILEEQERLLIKLQQRNISFPALSRRFPADLAPGSHDVNLESMTKPELVSFIIKLRKEMRKWYKIFTEAEEMM